MARLACPECNGSDELAYVERILGTCQAEIFEDEAQDEPCGYTDVEWDTSETIGVFCKSCNWQDTTPEWRSKLVVAVEGSDED